MELASKTLVQFILIYFSLFFGNFVGFFAYVNHARIRSWNQPALSNGSKVSCSRKQRGPLMGLELTTGRYPPITSQTRYPLQHAAFENIIKLVIIKRDVTFKKIRRKGAQLQARAIQSCDLTLIAVSIQTFMKLIQEMLTSSQAQLNCINSSSSTCFITVHIK